MIFKEKPARKLAKYDVNIKKLTRFSKQMLGEKLSIRSNKTLYTAFISKCYIPAHFEIHKPDLKRLSVISHLKAQFFPDPYIFWHIHKK